MKRVQANENDEAAKQRVIKDLNVSLGELTSNYEKAIAELQDCKRTLPEKMKVLQDQIDILHKKIQEIDKTEINTSNMVGHQGNTLIQCLIAVRAFSKTIEHQDSAYAPLVSILNGISKQF
jgi:prefoldin subunit 5